MKKLSMIISLGIWFMAGSVWAEKPIAPESYEGAEVVDSQWVHSQLGKIKIFDVRKKAEYVEGHLPGAISSPYKEKSEKVADFDPVDDELDVADFPTDKNEPVVVYCNGPSCWKSYKSTVWLVKEGYTQVKWFREGYPEWVTSGFATE